ncbi:uncharacterized protein LODBEIA_P09860 [Lodderomyces beijingensis]|uniref:Fe-S cluster assembly protein DRE2 n=1 Tax=Lodderomyces beijingensis TaxID=1775926 RepID=A0ABP0ZF29_9ASCO
MTTRILLLLHPTVVTDQHLVEQITSQISASHTAYTLDQQIINRVTQGDVTLDPAAYNEIHYINRNESQYLEMPISLIRLLYDLLQDKGKIMGDLPKDQNLDALMQGFIVQDDGSWLKPAPVTETVLLKPKKNLNYTISKQETGKKLPMFKKLVAASSPSPPGLTDSSAPNTDEENDNGGSGVKRKLIETKLTYFSDSSSDEETGGKGDDDDDDNDEEEDDDEVYVDENELIAGLKSDNLIVPKKCELPNGKRRRKACKDCTCGLKEIEEQEESLQNSKQSAILSRMAQSANAEAERIEQRLQKRNAEIVKFKEEDLTEIDFTVKGKTGGCGSCSLGDAFRCDGCPFLGLPPFKPGEVITLDGMDEDI